MLVIGFVLAFTTLATASNTYDMCLNLARNNSVIPPQYLIRSTFNDTQEESQVFQECDLDDSCRSMYFGWNTVKSSAHNNAGAEGAVSDLQILSELYNVPDIAGMTGPEVFEKNLTEFRTFGFFLRKKAEGDAPDESPDCWSCTTATCYSHPLGQPGVNAEEETTNLH